MNAARRIVRDLEVLEELQVATAETFAARSVRAKRCDQCSGRATAKSRAGRRRGMRKPKPLGFNEWDLRDALERRVREVVEGGH